MAQATTAGAWLNSIADMMRSVGMAPDAVFRQAGLEPAAMGDPHQRYDSDQMNRLWQCIAAASDNPAIALAASDSPRAASLDLLAYTMMAAPDLAGALQRLVRYIRVISDATDFTLVDDEHEGRAGRWLRVAIPAGAVPVPRQRYEFILITLLNVCRWIAGRSIRPLCVDFGAAPPADARPYAQAFGGPLRFGRPLHGILFAQADMAAPLPASNARLAELHERFAGDFLLQMDSRKLGPRVREIIARNLPDGDPPRALAAKALCISERTLQRRLRDEGTSYQQLLDDTRRELMRQYLAEDQIALGQIAFLLGFADQSTFCRACQRWFALSPSQFRKQLTAPRAAA